MALLERLPEACFNPTLVRLRLIPPQASMAYYRCFNPTLVRLRPITDALPGSLLRLFQSHAGSIEAKIRK